MRIIKTKEFKKWGISENISDQNLIKAISEIESGLIDVNLGGGLIKKRVAIGSSGKSGGARTIIAYKKGKRAFFLYGFKKNEMSNIDASELKALRRFGEILMIQNDPDIDLAIKLKQLYEVKT